jgi:uncharacterized protein YqgC (DUF456 family)
MEPQPYFFALAAILVVLGLAGTVVPVLPGILLVFGGLLLAAWADGFRHVGAVGLSIIGVLALLAFAADFVASLLGAKRVGASPLALAGAAAGGIVGVFLGIPGLIFGPFVGAVAGEYLARGRLVQAGKVGIGTWIGLILAAVAKVVIAFLMVGTFIASWLLA